MASTKAPTATRKALTSSLSPAPSPAPSFALRDARNGHMERCRKWGVYDTIPEAKPKEPERMINGLPASEYHRLYNAEWRKNHPDYWKAWKANQPTR